MHRHIRRILGAISFLILGAPSVAACRLALALGLDVSGSVDYTDYRLQMEGLAAAMERGPVRDVLLSDLDHPVYLAFYEWSGESYQQTIMNWRAIDGPVALAQVTNLLRNWQRSHAPASTGLGAAMNYGAEMLRVAPACDRFVLDISGDGPNNGWPSPDVVHGSGVLNGATLNALVIGKIVIEEDGTQRVDVEELSAYFHRHIIAGPGAFVEVATDYTDYERAMRRKLLREMGAMVMSATDTGLNVDGG